MAWFNRPEGFQSKSFDKSAPSVQEKNMLIETSTRIYLVGEDGWDLASVAKPEPEACPHCLDCLNCDECEAERNYYINSDHSEIPTEVVGDFPELRDAVAERGKNRRTK